VFLPPQKNVLEGEKIRFWNTILAYVLLRKSLWNGVPVRSITKIPVLPHLSNTIFIQYNCDIMENVIHCIVIWMFSALQKGTLNYNKKAGYIAKKSKYSKTWSLRNSRDKRSCFGIIKDVYKSN
jgi:hypothetical protein